jgi:prepilin signal peptidase PulO-like enzyme (type II secretory pathway)
MEIPIIFYILLFLFWTFFWSFTSVIIYRLKTKEKWILMWRSKCPKCQKNLKAQDLFPIFSYLFKNWKCRYCKEDISVIYLILELSTWLMFFLVWLKLINFDLILLLDSLELFKLGYFLFLALIIVIFVFYDILFLEINEGVLFVWIFITAIVITLQTVYPDFYIISTFHSNYNWIVGPNLYIIISIFLFVLVSFYIIILKWLKELNDILILSLSVLLVFILKRYLIIDIYDIPIISAILWSLLIFTFLFSQIVVSKWTWMWWWDLRIAILMGLILWYSYSFIWVMIAYIFWSIIGVFIIFIQKLKKKENINTIIPFGPFLWIGLFISLLFQKEINSFLFYYL